MHFKLCECFTVKHTNVFFCIQWKLKYYGTFCGGKWKDPKYNHYVNSSTLLPQSIKRSLNKMQVYNHIINDIEDTICVLHFLTFFFVRQVAELLTFCTFVLYQFWMLQILSILKAAQGPIWYKHFERLGCFHCCWGTNTRSVNCQLTS